MKNNNSEGQVRHEPMKNHQKTTVLEQLFGNYSFVENILANLGLESVIVASRAKALGYKVNPVTALEEKQAYKNVTLDSSTIDFD